MYKNCYRIYADKQCNTIIENDEFNPGNVYVYILQRNREGCNIVNQIVIKENINDPIEFSIGEDGYYSLCRIEVPLDITKPYYYFNGKFYKGVEEVELQELISINPEVSKLDIQIDDYFQICHLRQCFIDICYEIFKQTQSIRCNINVLDKNLIYKRDLLWSAINVIKYLVEQKQFDEAERLLNNITSCNGLCDSNQNKECGCCCGKVN